MMCFANYTFYYLTIYGVFCNVFSAHISFFRIDDYRALLILEGVSKSKNKEISPELSYA